MAQYFRLYKKGAAKSEDFVDIDEKICEHFNVPCDPKYWHHAWYDIIGLQLACGKDWDYIRKNADDDTHMVNIINFLENNYDVECWAGR